MARIDDLVRLFAAISKQDWPLLHRSAEQIIESEGRKGHRVAARDLRGALNHGRHLPRDNGATPLGGNVTETALLRLHSDDKLRDVRLPNETRAELVRFVEEWRARGELAERKLVARSKVLLFGPPGCGKSKTARALANEMNLSAHMIRFDAVIGAYLGQTATHLREIFAVAERAPTLMLVDELDALGKSRGNPLEVGELDRIVIALMQELEHSTPQGVIVATTNMPDLLDKALWRRFDLVLELPEPRQSDLKSFGRDVARAHGLKFSSGLSQRIGKCKNYAEAERFVEDEARKQVMRDLGMS